MNQTVIYYSVNYQTSVLSFSPFCVAICVQFFNSIIFLIFFSQRFFRNLSQPFCRYPLKFMLYIFQNNIIHSVSMLYEVTVQKKCCTNPGSWKRKKKNFPNHMNEIPSLVLSAYFLPAIFVNLSYFFSILWNFFIFFWHWCISKYVTGIMATSL